MQQQLWKGVCLQTPRNVRLKPVLQSPSPSSQRKWPIEVVGQCSEQTLEFSRIPQTSSQSGMIGMSWASTGGEASALFNDRYLAADGIDNVIHVLDEIETGHFPMLQFVELNACPGGCVGGVATVENPYIARVRLQALRRYLPVSQNRLEKDDIAGYPEEILFPKDLEYRPVGKFDEDLSAAMQKMSEIETLAGSLPALDCGSCGAPTCRAFAEDVVLGGRSVDECIVYMRERIQKLANDPEEEQT